MAWQSITLPINGIDLHVTHTREPHLSEHHLTLLAVHGRTGNGLLWTRTARLLSPHFDVIMPDLRGHGRSDAPVNG